VIGYRSVGGIVLVLALAGCGASRGGSPAASPSRGEPSASARMICAAEGKREIAASVGVDTTRPLVSRWRDHVYSCHYVYRDGTMALSVKELSTAAETSAYFDALGAKLGRMRALDGLGQGAYQTRNGATVVRKDHLVLLVDGSQLPAEFGTPSSPRADVSLSVAATIMGCWTGS
jgi:hypothetical protein